MKRKLRKIMLVLTMAFSLLFVSACTYSDISPDSNFGISTIGNLQGVKTFYRPTLATINDFYENFSNDFMQNLAKIFGLAGPSDESLLDDYISALYDEYLAGFEPEDEKLELNEFEPLVRIYFLDDIRNSIYLYSEEDETFYSRKNLNNSWKWTHDIETGNLHGYSATAPSNASLAKTYFQGSTIDSNSAINAFNDVELSPARKAERQNYYNFYATQFAPAMQVVVLQTILGRTPTNFSFNMITNAVEPNPQTILGDGTSAGLKFDYRKYADYIGISGNDKVALTNYVLDQVIGSQKYDNPENHFDRQAYYDIIQTVIWDAEMEEYYFSDETGEQQENLGSIFNIFPIAELKDYSTNSFFVSSQDKTAFSHIPAADYKSVLIMPSDEDYLTEIWFFLASDQDLSINYFYRYFDSSTGEYYESAPTSANVEIESEFSHETARMNVIIFKNSSGRETLIKTSNFNNDISNNLLKANVTKPVNYEISQFYEVVNNSFGLKKDKMQEYSQSFFEIVFEVDKSSLSTQDFSFKVGIQQFWFADERTIQDYLNG